MKKWFIGLMVMLLITSSFINVFAANEPIVTEQTVSAVKNGNFSLPTTPGAPTDWDITSIVAPVTATTEYIDETYGNALRITDNSNKGTVTLASAPIFVTDSMINNTFTLKLTAKKAGTANNTSKPTLSLKAYNIKDNLTTPISNTVLNFSYSMSSSNAVWSTTTKEFTLGTQITSFLTKEDGTPWTVDDIDVFRIILSSSTTAITTDIYFDDVSVSYNGVKTVYPLELKDANGEVLTALKECDTCSTISASVKIEDSIQAYYPVTVIVALYDNSNRLISTSIANNDLKPYGDQEIIAYLNIPPGEIAGKHVKAFAWGSMNNVLPIFEAVKISEAPSI